MKSTPKRPSTSTGASLAGPGHSGGLGVCPDIIRRCRGQVPIFGVCLGHQAIAEVFGSSVVRAPELLHGKTSLVTHRGQGARRPTRPFTATRYHSPRGLPTSDSLIASGHRDHHREWRDHGLAPPRTGHRRGAVHPDPSVLTEGGHPAGHWWLTRCGDTDAVARSVGLSPVVSR